MTITSERRPPLLVHVVWHPRSERGAPIADAFFRALCSHPDVPADRGLGIPVRFRTTVDAEAPSRPIAFGAAQHTAVVILADDELLAAPSWREYIEATAAAVTKDDVVIPVVFRDPRSLPKGVAELQAIRLQDVPDANLEAVLLNRVIHDLCRLLDGRPNKVKVFLSHAKHDGRELTALVRRHLNEVAWLDDFFDEADIPDGIRFSDFLLNAVASPSVLLAVQTDTYGSREWCRLEVLEAKRARIPIVILSATDIGESRAFPYMGNVPVIRWRDDSCLETVVGALLREVLRDRYFPQRVAAICNLQGLKPLDTFTYPPELLTALAYRSSAQQEGHGRGRYIYPDPPLGTEEVLLLRTLDPEREALTPTLLRAM